MTILSVPAPRDLGAHGDQEIGQVDHLGLARGVLEHGLAVRQCGGHHEVFGARHRHGFQHQARTLQAVRAGFDVAVLDMNIGAHRLQTRDVDVDRSRADRAAAGQGHIGMAEARQQRTQHENRRAHGFHELVGREIFLDRRCVDLDAHLFVDGHRDAHASEQFDHGGDILQVRHVRHRHRAVRQQAPGQNRQGGVLGSRNADLALERYAAVNLKFIHVPALQILRV